MSELKVSEEVLKQMAVRKAALASSNILVQMAQRELNLYMVGKLKELGLDIEKHRTTAEK